MAAVKYGDKVHIQNGYQDWAGGYLDTNGHSTDGDKYNVSTNPSPTRSPTLTGTWVFEPTGGQQTGSEVMSGDIVHIKNLYTPGTYLDTINNATPPSKYKVQTSEKPDRWGKGTGSWQLLVKSSDPGDGKLRYGDIVQCFNQYNNGNGGFLDTCGHSAARAGAKYAVVTSPYSDRANQLTAS